MKETLTIAIASAVMLMSSATSQAQMAALKSFDAVVEKDGGLVQKTGRRGRRRAAIGAGIAIGILGAAAAAHAHDRHYYRSRRRSRHLRNCRRWLRWCDRGEYRSCRRYDRRC